MGAAKADDPQIRAAQRIDKAVSDTVDTTEYAIARFAVIMTIVDQHARLLPLFVPMDQATGVAVLADADLSHPPGQLRAFHRLSHIVFRLKDARLVLPSPWRAGNDRMPLYAVIGLTDPAMALWDAVDAAGGA